MRWRSWVIITPPKRDDPIYATKQLVVFLPQSGFVQRLITSLDLFETEAGSRLAFEALRISALASL